MDTAREPTGMSNVPGHIYERVQATIEVLRFYWYVENLWFFSSLFLIRKKALHSCNQPVTSPGEDLELSPCSAPRCFGSEGLEWGNRAYASNKHHMNSHNQPDSETTTGLGSRRTESCWLLQCRSLNDGLILISAVLYTWKPWTGKCPYHCFHMLAYFDFLISEPQNVKSFEEIYISFPLGSRKIETLYFISMGRVI